MSEHAADTAARLEALEAHVAHQERIIADLNEVVTTQYRKIDRLERLVERLRESILSIAPQRDGPEPPPPHY
ncbi:MAG: SlyX family protein [Proteobacteria bacterium]|nr:SlyX family protein [Pseudomonadota bacterium]